MAGGQLPDPHQGAEHRGEMARALLERPGALVTALAPDGFRIALPPSLEVVSESRLPVPVPRATMIDLVVPDDGLTVSRAAVTGRRSWRTSTRS